MKYYVVSDVHGFYSILKDTLEEKGFFEDEGPKKLVICGDAFDRGMEAIKMKKFLVELLKKDELIYIKGNHEYLYVDLVDNLDDYIWDCMTKRSHHASNGTFSTAMQLARIDKKFGKYAYFDDLVDNLHNIKRSLKLDGLYKTLIPAAVNYYETPNYIFVHGWIPYNADPNFKAYHLRHKYYSYKPDWRNATDEEWEDATWCNGMEMAMDYDIKEHGKTIVCGHFHSSFGHSRYKKACTEFGDDAIFSPFEDDGIIAIDACTAHSGKINCIVIED